MPFNDLKMIQRSVHLRTALYEGGKLVFSHVMEHLPLHVFHRCVDRYNGDFKVKEFTCLDHYLGDDFALELDSTVYALDATTIDLCLSMFPWANYRQTKGAVKLHTLLDFRGNIPAFIYISDGKLHEVKTLNLLPIEPGTFYIMDRGYLDFERLYPFAHGGAFFVIRAKSNLKCSRT